MRVAVLCGGDSSEREISLSSGRAVHEALATAGMNAALIDIRGGDFVARIRETESDFAFLALHGKFGEDGTLQAVLDEAGIPYSGSGPAGARNAFDKTIARRLLADGGIAVPVGIVVDRAGDPRVASLKFPVFVKPASGGSSIGVSLVRRAEDADEAVEDALREDASVLVEERASGREITAAVLGGEVLPPIEIIPAGEFFDTRAKYGDAGTRYAEPDGAGAHALGGVRRAALVAHRLLGCSAFSRADMILTERGCVLLEVNAIPGLTPKSLLPRMARKKGISFEELCVRIIEESLKERYAVMPQTAASGGTRS